MERKKQVRIYSKRAFGNGSQPAFSKNSEFLFLAKNFFFYVLTRFDAPISKMIFKKKKKHHFDAFRHKKHFKKQPHFQTGVVHTNNL